MSILVAFREICRNLALDFCNYYAAFSEHVARIIGAAFLFRSTQSCAAPLTILALLNGFGRPKQESRANDSSYVTCSEKRALGSGLRGRKRSARTFPPNFIPENSSCMCDMPCAMSFRGENSGRTAIGHFFCAHESKTKSKNLRSVYENSKYDVF